MKRWTVFLATAIALACYAATEVEIDVSTDVTCSNAVTTGIFLDGRDGEEAEAQGCVGSDVGSFVVAPGSGSRDARVNVVVTMNTNGGTPHDCLAPASKAVQDSCIIARRSFAFTKHESRFVAVRMYGRCRGVPCDPTTSCVPVDDGGTFCEPAATEPTSTPSIPPSFDAGPADADVDATVPPPPVANPTCTGVDGTGSNVIAKTVGKILSLVAIGETLFWIERTTASATFALHGVTTNGAVVDLPTGLPPRRRPRSRRTATSSSTAPATASSVTTSRRRPPS